MQSIFEIFRIFCVIDGDIDVDVYVNGDTSAVQPSTPNFSIFIKRSKNAHDMRNWLKRIVASFEIYKQHRQLWHQDGVSILIVCFFYLFSQQIAEKIFAF